ncbi:MAG: Zn-dependent hydrolase [Alphaproteobacteria bacterium]
MESHEAAEIERLVGAVNEDRLWSRHMAIAKFGKTGRGGVNRQAMSPQDTAARQKFLSWAGSAGYKIGADAIGNIFVQRTGTDAGVPPVAAGSHLDSQPTGGNFDGVYGVLAALEVLDAATDIGLTTKRALEAIAWTNEEGSRFQPSTMGSNVFAGKIPLAEALASQDRDGVTVATALRQQMTALDIQLEVPFGAPMAAYLEAHIEQGPVLEATGNTIGVVSGIQGLRWFQIDVRGEEGHAGTTPHLGRRDAMAAAANMVTALQTLMADDSDNVRFTVGRFEVSPNSPNTIPGHVLFTIDFRHPEATALRRLGDQVEATCRAHAAGCDVTIRQTLNAMPTTFDADIGDRIRAAANRQNLPNMDMVSGATHDAKYMADLCPAGMIFVPCEGGRSHTESEHATPGGLAAGARVLAEVMVRLADA